MQTETHLLAQAQRFDPKALDILQQRFYESIYRYIHFKVGDTQASEDLSGDVFVRMLEAFKKGQGWRTTPDAWIFGIARNVVADYYRRQYRQPEVELNEGVAALAEQGPVEQMLNNEQRDHLVEAISSLRDEYRDVILLRFIEELSIKDVAEILDKTPGSVKGLQHRALQALSAIMQGFSGQDIVGKHPGGHLRQI